MSQSAADFLIAARQSEMRTLQQLLRRVRLVVTISGLVHALQRERGASGIFTGSVGRQFGQQRRQLVTATDQQLIAFDQHLAALEQEEALQQAGSRLLSRLALVLHQVGRRDGWLRRVAALEVDEDSVYDYYTGLIQQLLGVVFEVTDTATDSPITRALVALLHFLQGKELAGQERALGGARLASGQFRADRAEHCLALQEGQKRCLEIFARFAAPEIVAEWQSLSRDVAAQRSLDALRETVAAPPVDPAAEAALSEVWFDLCTARIDAMKQVEDHLARQLRRCAEQRLAQAREELEACQRDVHALAELDRLAGVIGESFGRAGEALDPAMPRSLVDLLETQARRLESMQEELQVARTALEERKLVDRAKALLIRQRGLSEHDAHALLRRLAMNQGCKLPEVARSVLNLADVFD